MGDVFNKIQKKYLNIPSGAANAAPEKGPRFNAIQKKYLSARPAAEAKAGEDDRAPSMAELQRQLSALPAAEPRRKDKKSAPALPSLTESAGTPGEPLPLPRWEGAAPWDAPAPGTGALYADFLNAEGPERAPAFRRRDRLEDDGLFALLSGEDAGGSRPLFGGEGHPARLWSGGERLRADRPEPDRAPGPAGAVRGLSALPDLRESGYRPVPLSAAEPTPLPVPHMEADGTVSAVPTPQPEADIRYFRNGDQTVWADMSTIQGIGVLPDGTYINTTGDKDADTLYEIKRAEAAGEISSGEADRRIRALAEEMAFDKFPDDSGEREKAFRENYNSFTTRSFDYYQIIDVTDYMNELIKDAEKKVLNDFGEKVYPVRLVEFFKLVKPGGQYDLKEWDFFRAHSLFLYNGEVVSRDVFGNVLYGDLGKTLRFDGWTLHNLAGLAQIFTKNSDIDWSYYQWDDPRDWQRVQEGIDYYKRTH